MTFAQIAYGKTLGNMVKVEILTSEADQVAMM